MTPWKAIEDLFTRVQAIENYLSEHKFDALRAKQKPTPVKEPACAGCSDCAMGGTCGKPAP